jgi:hypothetical protein
MTEDKKKQLAQMLATVCWIPRTKGACPSLCLGFCPFDAWNEDKEGSEIECLAISPQDWLDWMEQKNDED